MEKNIKQFIKDNKSFVVFYLIWFMINLTILASSGNGIIRQLRSGKVLLTSAERFWPFGHSGIAAYDKTEFLFYLIVPIVLLVIWKLIGDDVKKYLVDYKSNRKSAEATKPIDKESTKPIKHQESSSSTYSPKIMDEIEITNNDNKMTQREKTLKLIKWYWIPAVTYIVLIAVFKTISNMYMNTEYSGGEFIKPVQLWTIVFMFLFAIRSFKNAWILHKDSKLRALYSILWSFGTYILFFLGFIPLLIQSKMLKKIEQ